LIKIIIKEENFKWDLEAFASELFKYKIIHAIISEGDPLCCYSNI